MAKKKRDKVDAEPQILNHGNGGSHETKKKKKNKTREKEQTKVLVDDVDITTPTVSIALPGFNRLLGYVFPVFYGGRFSGEIAGEIVAAGKEWVWDGSVVS
ncbi:hypothetical protein L1887_16912 [Cichorium endivia]|nr:hypothetical protein L1887_16912 [Cichorium endivia]